MPRIPYITDQQAGPPELVASIQARRGGQLANLDRILLHSTPVAIGWGELLGRIRRDLALPAVLRELAMCAVAVLNEAAYELHHHGPVFIAEGGSEAQLTALAAWPDAAPPEGLFDSTEQAVLGLTLAMTRQVKVGEAVFTAARDALGSDATMFELISVIAAYNMVSRILVAVDIGVED